MRKLATLIFIITSLSSFAEEDYLFIVDPYLTPIMGAEDLISIQQGLMRLEDQWTHPERAPKETWAAGIGRFAEMVTVWNPINYTAMVTQHEVFGHTYRILDVGKKYAQVRSIHIGVPPPYGPGGGATGYALSTKASSTQDMAITMAGVESTAIMATRLKLRWLKEWKISGRQTSLYTFSQMDLTEYILSLDNSELLGVREGHDIENYLKVLNNSFPSGHLSNSQLKAMAAVNLLDPFLYYSLYGWWRYVVTGKNMFIPMIPIGSVRYLPAGRLGLTPFGPEFFFENFIVADAIPIYAYFKGGAFGENRYWGLGVEDQVVIQREHYTLGFRLDLWLQPRLTIHQIPILEFASEVHKDIPFQPYRFGGALSLIGTYKMGFAQLGYKSKGFLPGESLEHCPIIRLGIQGQF